jgi:uncharacterized membrane protein YfcA
MMLLAGALALVVGVVLGMLGGGGAILTLPLLVYVVGVDPKAGIAMSLFVVGSTSLIGTAVQAWARRVRWKVGVLFGVAAMVGAFAGGRIAAFIPAVVLLVAFACIMLVTAIGMLRGREGAADERRPVAREAVLALGVIVGVISGMVGAGGGFLIVPALTLFGGLTTRDGIGTSLFVIALQSFAGFAGHVGHVDIDWQLTAVVTTAAASGTIAGVFLGRKVSCEALRRGFAWLVLAMGLFVLGRQLPVVVVAPLALLAVAAILLMSRKKLSSNQASRKDPSFPRQNPCTTSTPLRH